jgi:hypothetical protein
MRIIMEKNTFLVLLTVLHTTAIATNLKEVIVPKAVTSLPENVDTALFPPHIFSSTLRECIDKTTYTKKLSGIEKWDFVSQIFSTTRPPEHLFEQEKIDAIKQEYLGWDFHKRPPVTTIFGWVSLASVENNARMNPKKHFALIRSLASDPKLIKKLDTLLQTVRKSESAILSFWKDEDPEIKAHIDALYTRKGKRHFQRNYSPAWQQFFTHTRTEKPDLQESGEFMANIFFTTCFELFTGLNLYLPTEKTRLYFYQLHKLLEVLHQRTKGLAQVTRTLDATVQTLPKHPELAYLPHGQELTHLKNILEQKSSRSLHQLFTLLRTNTFKDTLSRFSYRGRVRVAYLLINDFKNDLIPLLMVLGELDAYLAYVKMLQDSPATRDTNLWTV